MCMFGTIITKPIWYIIAYKLDFFIPEWFLQNFLKRVATGKSY